MREAYIVQAVRTPGCRRARGAFAQTRPEDLLKAAILGLMERAKGVEKKEVEDILVGCAFPEAEQGLNIGRIIAQMAGFPDDTCGATVNRFCASGSRGHLAPGHEDHGRHVRCGHRRRT